MILGLALLALWLIVIGSFLKYRALYYVKSFLPNPVLQDRVLIAYASQSSAAERIAWKAAERLHCGGIKTEVTEIGKLDAAKLGEYYRALFVVSTAGNGDPPDNAFAFVKKS